MTGQATTDQLTVFTRKDLAAFDKLATDLILEMQDMGWRGFITANQHASMRHPDGSVQSITRASNRAKSGTAMRARFESWKRRREQSASTFGLSAEEPVSMPPGLSVVTILEMKKHPAVGPFIEDRDPDVDVSQWVCGGFDDDPRAWAVFDTSKAYPVLVGYGSRTDEQGAWASLMKEHPELFPEPGLVADSEMQGDVMASVFACGECGKQFGDKRAVAVHTASAHHREQVACEHEGCTWVGGKHMLSRHVDAEHDPRMHACPFCGKEFVTKHGLGMHRGKTHPNQEPQPVTVQRMVVPAALSPAVDKSVDKSADKSAGVLLDHLEHLPQGADAEAMVAAVRSVVAGSLVEEVRRLREELVLMTAERDKFAKQSEDFEARLTLMREVMGV